MFLCFSRSLHSDITFLSTEMQKQPYQKACLFKNSCEHYVEEHLWTCWHCCKLCNSFHFSIFVPVINLMLGKLHRLDMRHNLWVQSLHWKGCFVHCQQIFCIFCFSFFNNALSNAPEIKTKLVNREEKALHNRNFTCWSLQKMNSKGWLYV